MEMKQNFWNPSWAALINNENVQNVLVVYKRMLNSGFEGFHNFQQIFSLPNIIHDIQYSSKHLVAH